MRRRGAAVRLRVAATEQSQPPRALPLNQGLEAQPDQGRSLGPAGQLLGLRYQLVVQGHRRSHVSTSRIKSGTT